MMRTAWRVQQWLDSLVGWTGIPRLVTKPPTSRTFRWLPFIPLVAGMVALVDVFSSPSIVGYAISAMVNPVCITSAVILLTLGPLKNGRKLDEREADLWKDAFLVSFWIVNSIQVMGIGFFLGFAVLQAWPRELIILRLAASFCYLFSVFFLIPTLYASWMVPSPRDSEE